MASRATRLGGRILKRLTKPIPIIGTAVVVATAIPILRSKGLMRGGLNIALDAIRQLHARQRNGALRPEQPVISLGARYNPRSRCAAARIFQ